MRIENPAGWFYPSYWLRVAHVEMQLMMTYGPSQRVSKASLIYLSIPRNGYFGSEKQSATYWCLMVSRGNLMWQDRISAKTVISVLQILQCVSEVEIIPRHSWVVNIHSLPCFAQLISRSVIDTSELIYVAKSNQRLKVYRELMQGRHVEYSSFIF
jgi:hypothetical protein